MKHNEIERGAFSAVARRMGRKRQSIYRSYRAGVEEIVAAVNYESSIIAYNRMLDNRMAYNAALKRYKALADQE